MIQAFQFNVTLLDSNPQVIRKIQISQGCTWWDLYVAINDAMGWSGCYEHFFKVKNPKNPESKALKISMIIDYDLTPGMSYDFEIKVAEYIATNNIFIYCYDDGRMWEHEVKLECTLEVLENIEYPRCIYKDNDCPTENPEGIHFIRDTVSGLELLANSVNS